tara:strand:- start:726 stop:884 length:159 start_codon:yes stop_codon:yes gene_type:complete
MRGVITTSVPVAPPSAHLVDVEMDYDQEEVELNVHVHHQVGGGESFTNKKRL